MSSTVDIFDASIPLEDNPFIPVIGSGASITGVKYQMNWGRRVTARDRSGRMPVWITFPPVMKFSIGDNFNLDLVYNSRSNIQWDYDGGTDYDSYALVGRYPTGTGPDNNVLPTDTIGLAASPGWDAYLRSPGLGSNHSSSYLVLDLASVVSGTVLSTAFSLTPYGVSQGHSDFIFTLPTSWTAALNRVYSVVLGQSSGWFTGSVRVADLIADNGARTDPVNPTAFTLNRAWKGAVSLTFPSGVSKNRIEGSGRRFRRNKIHITQSPLIIDENSSSTFSVYPEFPPIGDNITVAVTPSSFESISFGDAVSFSSGGLAPAGDESLNPKQITVNVAADTDSDNEVQTFTAVASPASSDSWEVGDSITITARDLNNPGISISVNALTVPEGGTRTYSVSLYTQPTQNVVVGITKNSDGDTDLSVDFPSLTFTPQNWNTGQIVTITNEATEGETPGGTAVFSHAVTSSADPIYRSGNAAIITGTVTATEGLAQINTRPQPGALVPNYGGTNYGRYSRVKSARVNGMYFIEDMQRDLQTDTIILTLRKTPK